MNAEVLAALLALADEAGVAERRDAMFRGDHINVTEDRAVLHTALRLPRDATLEVDGQDVVADVHEVLDRVYAFADAVRSGDVDRRHRRADPHGRQHRHRRLRPRSGDGLRGAGAVPAGRPGVPVHLQHRPDRRRARRSRVSTRRRRCSSSPARPSAPSRRSPTPGSARPGCSTACADQDDDEAVREALRRRLHRPRQGRGVRDRPGQRVRLLGLGRRPLLGRLGDRHLARRRDRSRAVRGVPGRHARDGRALPDRRAGPQRAAADGPAQRLVLRPPRLADARRAAVLAAAAPLPGVPPAADHGVQRQGRALGRHARRRRHRRGLLGRARHQRAARVLPADPPGHPARAGRLHRLRQPGLPADRTATRTSTSCSWPTSSPRPGRSRSARPPTSPWRVSPATGRPPRSWRRP